MLIGAPLIEMPVKQAGAGVYELGTLLGNFPAAYTAVR
jgi:hypothetical protein